MNSTESIPQIWDDGRDEPFFRLTSALFEPSFAYGAGVLLATYDSDDDDAPQTESAGTTRETRVCPADAPTALPVHSSRDALR